MTMLGPFPVAKALERLSARAPVLKLVGDAADLVTALNQQPRVSPAAYVTSAELGRAVKYTGPVAQQNCDVTLRVVLFVKNYAQQATGSGARHELDSLVIPQVRAALFGWAPNDVFDSLHFQAGRDEPYAAGWLVSQQVFGTNYRMSQQVMP
ncbi:phage tail terminator protein [Stenotrophomonas acidaminiphila]|uniref:phage tail terminator protein n=1 Tax=Stenotrophomonas acidaminiphila TaxID=128780 RepID=UPI0028A7EE66|nr:hypothetical protein [Stenotrophomonas acidaminiphila]